RSAPESARGLRRVKASALRCFSCIATQRGAAMKPLQSAPKPELSGRRTADRARREPFLDPYQARRKLKGSTVCPKCGAVYHHGRWQWGPRPDEARAE